MIHKFDLPKAEIFGLAKCIAAVRDIRYYLNVVLLEFDKDGICYAVATDGQIIAAFRLTAAKNSPFPRDISILIPQDFSLLFKPNRQLSFIPVEYDDEKRTIRAHSPPMWLETKAVEEKFPDWRKVFPKSVSGIPGQYQPQYMRRFDELSKIVCGKSGFEMGYNGASGACLVHLPNRDFVGAIMPINQDAVAGAPAWALLPETKKADTPATA